MPELLAPARDRGAFLAALAAGADAVYVGVAGGLNARRRAAGLGEDELPALCALAHAHGARVYVAANVVVKQAELAGSIEAARRVAEAGVDALIVQDWGLFAELRRALPELELHVSTQANVHDARGIAWCARRGAARVTLSRELPLVEIAAIAEAERARSIAVDEVPCELEVFAHGAICPGYSGLCMLSSFLREGRSPNRGLCAQPCRLPFDLVAEDGGDLGVSCGAGGLGGCLCSGKPGERLQSAERERALCTHDNCAIDDVPALAAVGVASLKIEGRMKPAAYVHAVTSAWRTELDALAPGEGHGDGIASMIPGGAPMASLVDGGALAAGGEAASARRRALKRSFNRGFTDAYLHGGSGNELMSYERSGNRGELVGEVAGFEPEPGFVPRDGQQLRGEALVRLHAPVDEGDSLELRPPSDPERFLVAKASRAAAPGELLRVCVPRPMAPGCEARLVKSVALERAAAEAVAAMEAELRLYANAEGERHMQGKVGTNCLIAKFLGVASQGNSRSELCALTSRVEDVAALRAAGAARIYLDVVDIEPTPTALAAACAAGCVPVLDEVCREPDRARIDPWMAPGQPVAVGNVSELALAAERSALPELRSCIPVHNIAAARALAQAGASAIWLSSELSLAEIRDLALAIHNDPACAHLALGTLVYGRPRLMTCEHCVLQVAYDCDRNHAVCPHRARQHALVNIDGRYLPVHTDARGRSRIYLDEPLDLTPYVQALAEAGVMRFLVDCRGLARDEAALALRELAAVLAEGPAINPAGPAPSSSRGTVGLLTNGAT